MRLGTAALGGLAVLSSCGNSQSSPAAVSWDKPPIVVRQPELPDDTIVSGEIRNRSGHTMHLDAADVRVLGADGGALPRSTARFTTGVTHQLYPPRDGRPREKEPAFLRRRLGEEANLAPGRTTPFVVSWRVRKGESQPVKVDLGDGSLSLP